jgi:hypothetical protein
MAYSVSPYSEINRKAGAVSKTRLVLGKLRWLGIMIAALFLAVCELPGWMEDGGPEGGGAGLVILLPGAPDGTGRAVIANSNELGTIGHPSVQRLLTYKIRLTKGTQEVIKAAHYNESMYFNLEPGVWTVEVHASFPRIQANDPNSTDPAVGPKTVTLTEGQTQSVAVGLALNPDLDGVVLIPDAETLKLIGVPPANGGWNRQGKKFHLLADLELENWVGLEIWGDPFASPQVRTSFNGGGHTVTIKSFDIDLGGDCGLFYDANLVDFKNLNIKLETTSPVIVGTAAGGLTAGASNVNIEDVHVSGILYVGYLSSNAYGGGIAGELTNGTVTNCSSTLNLKMESLSSGSSSVGGLLGEMNGVTIEKSFSNGWVEGTWAGGILGRRGLTFITTSPNTISYCYSAGIVYGYNPGGAAMAGGIAGGFDGDVTGSILEASYSIAEILCEGLSGSYAGGIAGSLSSSNGTITNCLALNGSITGTVPPILRRVVGSNGGTLLDNKGLDLMNFSPSYTPPSPAYGYNVDGYDIDPLDSSDVANTVLDPTMSGNVFVMPPSNWNHRYPVFQWQIDKGIQP